MRPAFNFEHRLWFDRGGIYVVANIRGGGEYGKNWHESGMLDKKPNVFDDMIAAAEFLIAEKYTSSQKLATTGGSNGGLLMGVMLNQHPEMVHAAIIGSPLLDMLRYDQLLAGASQLLYR
jgi:prolyl oligopeptidase